jgi:NAD(P)-dependent dehydrogenase (short-subunit alcohol dehydrogenase family)
VTGASRGIGKEIAVLLGREGAKVVAAARTGEKGEHQLAGSISETVQEVRDAGGQAISVRCDVSRQEDIERLMQTAHKEYGPVDILVNNAALTYFMLIEDFPLNRWQKMIQVDLTAPFLLAQAVLPDMIAAGRGHILNISSGAARHPQGPPYEVEGRGGTTYGMVKAGLERFTTGLAHELYDRNIAVNALSPTAVVATPGVLYHKLIPNAEDPRAEPVEYMARAALILVSGDPRKMTGLVTYSQPVLREHGGL